MPTTLTIATDNLRDLYVSTDAVRALTMSLTGKVYSVKLHALADRTFYVEADSVDMAQARAVQCVRAERPFPNTGATVQLFSEGN